MKRNTGDINVESIKLATSLTSDMSALNGLSVVLVVV